MSMAGFGITARRWGTVSRLAALTAGAALLAGCALFESVADTGPADDAAEAAPASQRIQIMALDERLAADEQAAETEVVLPGAYVNAAWSQPGGVPSHALHHLRIPSLDTDAKDRLRPVWTVDAGAGSSGSSRLTAPPVIADGKIYVLDARATVRAFSAEDGDQLWRKRLVPDGERATVGFGGGVSVSGERLIVATGFGEVHALNTADGETLWSRSVGVPIRSAPTVSDNRVFVIATDNQLHSFDIGSGMSLWSYRSMDESAGILSAVSPAVAQNSVIAPFSSGELVAIRIQNGREVWSDSLVRTGKVTAMAGFNDIAARPIVDDGRVFAVSHSGRLVSIDQRTGERVWARNIAGTETPWIAGDYLFMLTVDAELICITRRDGRVRWVTRLKRYENVEKREGTIAWAGPVLVSGRLVTVNSNGEIAFFSPETGKVLTAYKGPGKMFIAPVVADGTAYVLTDDAKLVALQ